MVKAGKYTAKVLDFGIGQTKAGDANVMVLFGFKDGDGVDQNLIWRGSLKEGKAREITIDALLTLGLRTNELADLAAGNGSGVLDQQKEVQVSVEHETYEGKTFAKIKYVNELGGGAFKDRMTTNDAVTKLAGLNLGGDIMSRRQAKGYATPTTPATQKLAGATMSEEDVPF